MAADETLDSFSWTVFHGFEFIHLPRCVARVSFVESAGTRSTAHAVEATRVRLARRGQLKCDGTSVETRFRFLGRNGRVHLNQLGASVQSTTGSRGVRISGSNAGYTMFRGSVKSTGYPIHSPVSPSLPLLCVAACHHISTGVHYWY